MLGTVVAAFFYEQLIAFLIDPLPGCVAGVTGEPEGHKDAERCGVISVNGLLSPFSLVLKVSISAGVVAASPVWLYQLWGFVAPGLHRNEKKYTLVLLGAGVPLFLAGAAVAYWALPATARVLISFTPHGATNLLPVDDFLDLATRMVVVFGISFELPVFLVLLNLAGVISARRMIGWWRGKFMGITAFAALATPSTDPLSMLLLAAPISLLYLGACTITWGNDRRRERRDEAEPHADLQDTEASPMDLTPVPVIPADRSEALVPAQPVRAPSEDSEVVSSGSPLRARSGSGRSAAIAVPVQYQDRGVVLEVALAGLEHRGGQASDSFSWMQRTGVVNNRGQVHSRGTALLHSVGQQDHAVSGLQLQFLHAVGGGCRHTERQVHGECDLFDGALTQSQWPGVAGVDQFTQTCIEIDAQQLPGGQAAAVAQQGLMRVAGLREGVTAAAA